MIIKNKYKKVVLEKKFQEMNEGEYYEGAYSILPKNLVANEGRSVVETVS